MIDQIRKCILEHNFKIEQLLPLVTANTAKALKLEQKGVFEEGTDADLLILRKDNLVVKDVISNGQRLFKNGRLNLKENFLKESNREVRLKGEKT